MPAVVRVGRLGKEEVGGELKRGKRNDERLKERGRDRVEWGV